MSKTLPLCFNKLAIQMTTEYPSLVISKFQWFSIFFTKQLRELMLSDLLPHQGKSEGGNKKMPRRKRCFRENRISNLTTINIEMGQHRMETIKIQFIEMPDKSFSSWVPNIFGILNNLLNPPETPHGQLQRTGIYAYQIFQVQYQELS